MDIKVGDILANIRKAVDDDMDALAIPSTGSQAKGTLMRGVLREMRVTMSSEPPANYSVREEIETLRDRIKRKGEATSLLAAPVNEIAENSIETVAPPSLAEQRRASPQPPTQATTRGDFSGIMAGAAQQRTVSRPSLRPSLMDEDHFSGGYQGQHGSANDQAWDEEPAYVEDYQEQAYAAEQQHYQGRPPEYPLVQQQPMLSSQAEAATETAFRHLSESLLARATGDRGLEDMTRELLRGMIKQWLDANLPALVEDLVREEIERVARRGR